MTIGLLVALTGSSAETAALTALSNARGAVHVVRRCMDIADLLATAATRQAAAALVSTGFRGLDSDAVARLADEGVLAIGVVEESDSADHARLRRMGVRDVLVAEGLSDVGSFVASAIASRTRALAGSTEDSVEPPASRDRALAPTNTSIDEATLFGQHDRRGGQIAVWGPTGAPGRSTIAVGIAAELARRGVPTFLVDADVYGGTIAQQLGILDEASGLLASTRVANAGDLTHAELDRHARTINPTLRVLTGLPRADRWPEVRPVLIESILSTARSWAPWTVVDCGFSLERDEELTYDTAAPRRNGATVAILRAVDQIVVVGSADPVGLTRLARALTELDAVVRPARVRVVVNRHRASIGWSPDEIRGVLERFGTVQDLVALPNDQAACDRALVEGKTLIECAAGSRLVHALAEFTSDIIGAPADSPRSKRRRRLMKRRAARGR
jgi:MinD-like ATPase involved in chromosome partitioning or flagellar assembly